MLARKTVLLLALLVPGYALAAGGTTLLYKTPNIDETDKAAIQRGARVFVNYCLTCHSAEYITATVSFYLMAHIAFDRWMAMFHQHQRLSLRTR